MDHIYMDHMVETKDLNPNAAWGCTIFSSFFLVFIIDSCGLRIMAPTSSCLMTGTYLRYICDVFASELSLDYLECIQYLNMFLVDSFKRRFAMIPIGGRIWKHCWLVVSNIFHFPFHIWDNHPSHWLSYFKRWLLHHQPVIVFFRYPLVI